MKAIFRINYHTHWGESLWISGSVKTLGKWDKNHALQMEYSGNGEWEASLNLGKNETIQYKYFLKRNENIVWESGNNRLFDAHPHSTIEIRDFWRQHTNPANTFFTKPFTGVFMKLTPPTRKKKQSNYSKSVLFRLRAPRVPRNMMVAIIGNQKDLGNWKKPIAMDCSEFPLWKMSFDITQTKYPIDYKYVIIDKKNKEIIEWEEGNERSIFYIDNSSEVIHIQNDEEFRYSNPAWKGAGVAVPVFSLRTEESFGVGEFNDLKKLVDWCVLAGQKMIQLLPVNETVATHSWLDSYPYKSISVLALHPIYLNLETLGTLNDEKLNDEFNLAKDVLNSKPFVDYVQVTKFKSRYFKLIFDQEWKKVKRTKAYKIFFEENREWLQPYAAFCFLRDRYKTSNFREWGPWSKFLPDKISKLTNPKAKHHEHIAVHYFIQYNLDQQLKAIVNYAHEHGVALKGDIPVGISPDSIEAWTEPKLFNLKGQTGAPPDDFAVLGQNWGFPTYNWDEMAKDDFAWWRKRLNMMAKYFDAYRIDHILGFFRIWEIPKNTLHGLLGYFKPALPLSLDEITDYGIWFDEKRFTEPYIRGHFLHEIFGKYTDEVRMLYLDEPEYNVFELKKEFKTQRSIYNHFTPETESGQKLSGKNVIIRDGLISLLDEILFIHDPYSEHLAYHPRITLHYTYSYSELDAEIKNNIDNLYIDFFYKRHEEFWKKEALSKLPFIVNAGNMMVCGEDLGMIPESVPYVMNELNILSLEIQRMPKNPDIEFTHPADAPYMSVCTTSTHDMSTIRGWWEENRERTQRFYHTMLGRNGQAPYYAEPWICKEIVNQHLHSSAMWTIYPIQDLVAMDGTLRWDQTDKERINVPSDERNQWKYRMILTLEELLRADEFNETLSQMIRHSGRLPEV
ncbi:MAG: 4-alpha-glucanotransferase [Prolixibacteraceae bacterium]|jgi:4-alpha-glucanotransferase|nr:4-alpha-glucanotransferase [Prolixibacteraceae bacterium]